MGIVDKVRIKDKVKGLSIAVSLEGWAEEAIPFDVGYCI